MYTRPRALGFVAVLAACSDAPTVSPEAGGIRRVNDRNANIISHDHPGILGPTGIANDGLLTLYVSTTSGNTFVIDMTTNHTTGIQPGSRHPRDIVWAWGRGVFHSDEDRFVQLDQFGTPIVESIPWAGGGIAHWRDSLYVGARDSDSILVMTWSTFSFLPRTIVRKFETPTRNEGLVADTTETVPSFATLWSVGQTDGWLTEIDLEGNFIRRCNTPYTPGPMGLGGVTLLRDTFFLAYPIGGDPLAGTRITAIPKDELDCAAPDSIDIEPGRFPNRVNLRAGGRIEVVAIATPERDVTTLNLATARFGPGNAEPDSYTFRDVDRDGDIDAVFLFRIRETGLSCGDTSARLLVQRHLGPAFDASDSIVTTGCGRP